MPETVWFHYKLSSADSSCGRPLGEVLRRKGVSLRLVRRLKRTGGILVNGRPTRTDYRLQPGDVVELVGDLTRQTHGGPFPPTPPPVVPEEMPLQIIYEDDAILAVAKPAGMLTHPVKRQRSGTLANGVAYHLLRPLEPTPAGADRAIVVHPVSRLDRETSGIVLFARNPHVHHRLQEALDRGLVHKEYLAVVAVVRCRSDGWPAPPGTGIIDWPLAPGPGHSSRQQVCPSGVTRTVSATAATGAISCRPARTEYRCLELFPPRLALVAVQPVTGRTHQIRVHLAAAGWPILGDPLYGPGADWQATLAAAQHVDELLSFERMALHAWQLCFPHPSDNRELVLEAPIPDELQHLLNALRRACATSGNGGGARRVPAQPGEVAR